MSFLKRTAGVAFVLLTVTSNRNYAQDSTRISLRQAVETAISNNLDVKQSDLQSQTAEVNYRQAKSNLLPALNGMASHGINQGRSIDPFTNSFINQRVNFASYGLNAGVLIFSGLGIQNSIRQTNYAYKASRMELQQAKDNLMLSVILAYLDVLSNEELVSQARNQAALSKRQVERLEILNSDGAIPPAQLSDLRGELAGNELAVVNNENALETSKLNLCQLMNIAYRPDFNVEKLSLEEVPATYGNSPDKIYETALNQLSLVKGTQLRKQSAENAVKVARSFFYPTLSLNGGVNTNYSSAAGQNILVSTSDITTNDYVLVNNIKTAVISPQSSFRTDKIAYNKQLDNNLYTSVSLDLRLPIFNAFQTKNRVKLAKIQLKNTDYIEQTTRIQLKQSIEQAFVNMTSADNRYKVIQGQVKAFSESFKAAEVKFNAGVGTVVDYIIAKNNLDRANINLIMARYDYILRTKILDYYQAKPLW
ncbi:MAG: TolC family protein [Gemmatimonadaceae bacterium]|nr:TolC family protein [Chitinophagaceae bacterium]